MKKSFYLIVVLTILTLFSCLNIPFSRTTYTTTTTTTIGTTTTTIGTTTTTIRTTTTTSTSTTIATSTSTTIVTSHDLNFKFTNEYLTGASVFVGNGNYESPKEVTPYVYYWKDDVDPTFPSSIPMKGPDSEGWYYLDMSDMVGIDSADGFLFFLMGAPYTIYYPGHPEHNTTGYHQTEKIIPFGTGYYTARRLVESTAADDGINKQRVTRIEYDYNIGKPFR